MSEKNLIKWRYKLPLGNSISDYANYQSISSAEELEKKFAANDNELVTFVVEKNIADEFLKSLFEQDLEELMLVYCKQHFSGFLHEMTEAIVRQYRIPEKVIVSLQTFKTEEELTNAVDYYSKVSNEMCNLHDGSVRRINVLHADFETNFEYGSSLCAGYFYHTNSAVLFLQASPQFDLTIVYYNLQ